MIGHGTTRSAINLKTLLNAIRAGLIDRVHATFGPSLPPRLSGGGRHRRVGGFGWFTNQTEAPGGLLRRLVVASPLTRWVLFCTYSF